MFLCEAHARARASYRNIVSTIGTPLLAAFSLTRENRVFKPKKRFQVTRAGWARGRRPGRPVPQALNLPGFGRGRKLLGAKRGRGCFQAFALPFSPAKGHAGPVGTRAPTRLLFGPKLQKDHPPTCPHLDGGRDIQLPNPVPTLL